MLSTEEVVSVFETVSVADEVSVEVVESVEAVSEVDSVALDAPVEVSDETSPLSAQATNVNNNDSAKRMVKSLFISFSPKNQKILLQNSIVLPNPTL